MNYPINFTKIEDIKIQLWYSNDRKFANDCGISYPTYLETKKTKTSGMKFINWINKLLTYLNYENKTVVYFLQDGIPSPLVYNPINLVDKKWNTLLKEWKDWILEINTAFKIPYSEFDKTLRNITV